MHILLVEDRNSDVALTRWYFRQSNSNARITHTGTLKEATDYIKETSGIVKDKIDVIILDLNLPDALGKTAISSLVLNAPSTPIVILTGSDEMEDEWLKMPQTKAYFLKNNLVPAKFVQRVQEIAEDGASP